MPNSWRPAAYCRPAGRWASPRPCLRQSPARFAQSGGRCEAEAGNRLWLAKALSRMTRTSKGAAHVGAVEILTKIHQRQEGAEDAGLEVVRQVQAARGNAGQALSVLRQKVHDLAPARDHALSDGARRAVSRRISAQLASRESVKCRMQRRCSERAWGESSLQPATWQGVGIEGTDSIRNIP